jgi:hypothetical protein
MDGMNDDPQFRANDLTTWPFSVLLTQLDAYRERQSKEGEEIVRTALQHKIDDIVAELDRRNRERLTARAEAPAPGNFVCDVCHSKIRGPVGTECPFEHFPVGHAIAAPEHKP